ncbi:MAG: hypothetical protein ABIT37_14480 [Luteolibacter sp.]
MDNQNRNDVIAFWHAVYQASEGYDSRVGWTGNYTGTPGSTAIPFVNDVERRLNYFRAMCGVPADAQVNTGSKVVIELLDLFKPASSTLKSTAAQQSALMLIRNFSPATGTDLAITHDPVSSLTGWSPAAWNASAKGNFSFGLYGPGAVTEYMVEALTTGSATSAWNSDVGHRRWCIFPPATDYATGDQPGSSAQRPPSNVLYVMQHAEEYLTNVGNDFVSYPPAGYFPAPLNSPFWSLSCADANFSVATVTMKTADNKTVPVTNIKRKTGFGDPAIVWQVSADVATKSVFNDTTYKVRVDGISGASIPTFYEYQVNLINPDRLTSSQLVTGPSKPRSNTPATYSFSPPPGAEALQVVAFKRSSATWAENAEKTTKALVIDDTGENYDLMATVTSFAGFSGVSGPKSFHLTFPKSYDLIARGVPEQSFELDRNIIANAKAKLNFMYRRGFMTTTSNLVVEISSNDGLTWKALGSPIKGKSNSVSDANASKASLALPKSATPIRIRFRYYTTGGAIYTHEAAPKSPTGIFIDEINTTNCDWLERKKQNTVATSSNQFVFNKTTAGAKLVKGDKWLLRLETKVGGKWFNGPAKALTIGPP